MAVELLWTAAEPDVEYVLLEVVVAALQWKEKSQQFV